MITLTPEQAALVERLRGLLAKATPGPWEVQGTLGRIEPSRPSFDLIAAVQVSNMPDWLENAHLIVEAVNALPTLLSFADTIESQAAEIAALRERAEKLSDLLDTERYKVAIGVQAVARAVQGRKWLSEPGRGAYAYDDERYQAEFGAALDEVDAALNVLRSIARDWSDCPRDPLRVAANRQAALNAARNITGEGE